MARIYRFNDKVAIDLGDGANVYLSPKAALAIGFALSECAYDIGKAKFTESLFSTVEVPEDD